MKPTYHFSLALGLLCGLALLVLPGFSLLHPARGQTPPPPAAHRLTSLEEAIIEYPFAPEEAATKLLAPLSRPHQSLPTLGRGDMGWAWPDQEYWQRIPPAARQIPLDWSSLPGLRFTNSQMGGVRQLQLYQGPEYDQWLLLDPKHHLDACISVQRNGGRVYFMQFVPVPGGGWQFIPARDNCYSCHASGPRVIRPLKEASLDQITLARFNRLILSYGACDFGESVDTQARGAPLDDPRCISCHNSNQRGKLYGIHSRTIAFKTGMEDTMPPESH